MLRLLVAITTLIFGLSFFTVSSLAMDIKVGDSCSSVGTSLMIQEQTDVVVCLKDASGNLVWKSTTPSMATGAFCGYLGVGTLPYSANCGTSGNKSQDCTSTAYIYYKVDVLNIPCEGQQLTTEPMLQNFNFNMVTSQNCRSGKCYAQNPALKSNCPAGYAFIQLGSSRDATYDYYSCIKN